MKGIRSKRHNILSCHAEFILISNYEEERSRFCFAIPFYFDELLLELVLQLSELSGKSATKLKAAYMIEDS